MAKINELVEGDDPAGRDKITAPGRGIGSRIRGILGSANKGRLGIDAARGIGGAFRKVASMVGTARGPRGSAGIRAVDKRLKKLGSRGGRR